MIRGVSFFTVKAQSPEREAILVGATSAFRAGVRALKILDLPSESPAWSFTGTDTTSRLRSAHGSIDLVITKGDMR